MSWVRIWVHLVFSTKNRYPYLNNQPLREKVFSHILENAESKSIWIDSVNGYSDHAHCLISLGREQTISNVAKLIKGESSFWINKEKLTASKFIWQDDYWAVGVSESHVKSVRNYIADQEKHHSKVAFTDEVSDFMDKHGWVYVKK